jgi:hypothetical protein
LLINFAPLKINSKQSMCISSRLQFTLVLLASLVILAFASCRKHELISNDASLKLSFSADSVVFDTVFTSLGTVTLPLKVYNRNNARLNISSIFLNSGNQSAFRMNVDGTPGIEVNNIEIAPNDSLFVFIRATIDPLDQSNPFVVEDDIIFNTNGNEQSVKLVAWGQDAVYILANRYIPGFPRFKIVADSLETTVWTADKPYVVYGYALIDSYGELIIEEGARIHFHDKSGLWAFADGVLKVRGTQENPVLFQGDRLDQAYRNIPGQWDRIWLMEGRQGFDHEIDYAIIRNGFIGLQLESFLRPTQNKLKITNTIIENHTGMGIYAILHQIDAENLVVANTGSYTVALTGGGNYNFRHATIANNWSYSVRNSPVMFMNNWLTGEEGTIPIALNVGIGNSIVHGSNPEEIILDFVEGAASNFLFDHCNIRTQRNLNDWPQFVNCISNQSPRYRNYQAFNFRPDTLSPVIGMGSLNIAALVPYDLDGVNRTAAPDLGAYQFVPIEPEEKRKKK